MSRGRLFILIILLFILTACENTSWFNPAKANVQNELNKRLNRDIQTIDMTEVFPFEWDWFICMPPDVSSSHALKYSKTIPKSHGSEIRYLFIKNGETIRYDAYAWPIVSRMPDNINVVFHSKENLIFVANRAEAKLVVDKIQLTENKILYSLSKQKIDR